MGGNLTLCGRHYWGPLSHDEFAAPVSCKGVFIILKTFSGCKFVRENLFKWKSHPLKAALIKGILRKIPVPSEDIFNQGRLEGFKEICQRPKAALLSALQQQN